MTEAWGYVVTHNPDWAEAPLTLMRQLADGGAMKMSQKAIDFRERAHKYGSR